MKAWLLLIFCLIFFIPAKAQDYQCLQSGVKHYFINGNGYLRGIRIDSVRTSGTDIIYYPFHTARGNYLHTWTTPIDSNGGSWLGKKVIQQNDGTFLFDNIWNDTVIVKPQAHTGDSWTFYNDTTARYYTATVTAQDTMTILGGLDSIKTIRINAYNASGIAPTDSINYFEIILSKNSGFVKIFDLYTFPYHRPDTTYVKGIDFYFDYISIPVWCSPSVVYANSIFKLVQLVNPTYAQLNDWNIGDVFENSVFGGAPSDGTYPYGYCFDSITAKTIVTGGIQYNYSGWKATMHITPPWILYSGFFNPSLPYPYDTFSTSGTLTFTNEPLIDTTIMPEEYNQKLLCYYYPNDTSYCQNSIMYKSIEAGIYNYTIFCSEASPTTQIYKPGIGRVKYNWNILGGSPPLIVDTTLLYFVKSGTPCGRYTYPHPINYLAKVIGLNKNELSIFPNPTTEELTIKTNFTQPYTISLSNMMGQTATTLHSNKQQETLKVIDFPAGIYNVSITDDSGNRYNEKVTVLH